MGPRELEMENSEGDPEGAVNRQGPDFAVVLANVELLGSWP
jgi:hypothetical protein